MTLHQTGNGNGLPPGGPARRDLGVHAGELKLRRFLAGELSATEQSDAAAHTATCVDCARRLDGLREEQRSFEARVSFDRFSAGVERAARVPAPAPAERHWWARPASTRSFITVMSIGSLAAVLALVVGTRPLFENARARRAADGEELRNRIKGGTSPSGAALLVRVADPGDSTRQRTVLTEAPEPLAVAERIRIAIQSGSHRFLFALSIDDQGVVTALYPTAGESMAVAPGSGMQTLPDSLELTGKGWERLVVTLTDQPLSEASVRDAAAAAYRRAGGKLAALPRLALPGEQFHRLFIKP